MPSIFSLIDQAWSFYKTQPVLNSIIFWMIFLPVMALDGLVWMFPKDPEMEALFVSNPQLAWTLTGGIFGLSIIVVILTIWADAAILLTGKKIINSKAGRNRSSMQAVLKEAKPFIVPLFLTGLLMACFTFFWSLLLIIPGIIYAIRATFYEVIVVTETKYYREALNQSKSVVTGHTLQTFLYIAGLSIILFAPIGILEMIAELLLTEERLFLASKLLTTGIWTITYLIFLLSLVVLYGELKKLPKLVKP